MYNKFYKYILEESRKSDAIENFKKMFAVGSISLATYLKIFELFSEREKPDTRMGNQKFSDKYPKSVLNTIAYYGNLEKVENYFNKIPPLFPKMTSEEKNELNVLQDSDIEQLIEKVHFRLSGGDKKGYEDKLAETMQWVNKGEAKLIINDPDKLLIVSRAYTFDASEAIGWNNWCTCRTEGHFLYYQGHNRQYPNDKWENDSFIYYVHLFSSNPKIANFAKMAVHFENIEHHDGVWDYHDKFFNFNEVIQDINNNPSLYKVTGDEVEQIIEKLRNIKDSSAEPGITKKFEYGVYRKNLREYVWLTIRNAINDIKIFSKLNQHIAIDVNEDTDEATIEASFEMGLTGFHEYKNFLSTIKGINPRIAAFKDFIIKFNEIIYEILENSPYEEFKDYIAVEQNTKNLRAYFSETINNITYSDDSWRDPDIEAMVEKIARFYTQRDQINIYIDDHLNPEKTPKQSDKQPSLPGLETDIEDLMNMLVRGVFKESLKNNKKKSLRIIIG